MGMLSFVLAGLLLFVILLMALALILGVFAAALP